MINEAEFKNRIKLMAIEALLVVLLFLVLKIPWAVFGLALGSGAAIFNYWLVARHTLKEKNDGQVKNPLGSYLIRLVIAGTIITVTGLTNITMLFGALFGLTLEMQTYLWDAVKLLFRRAQ